MDSPRLTKWPAPCHHREIIAPLRTHDPIILIRPYCVCRAPGHQANRNLGTPFGSLPLTWCEGLESVSQIGLFDWHPKLTVWVRKPRLVTRQGLGRLVGQERPKVRRTWTGFWAVGAECRPDPTPSTGYRARHRRPMADGPGRKGRLYLLYPEY